MTKPRHEIKLFINLSDYYVIKGRLKHIARLDLNTGYNDNYHIRSLYFDNFNDKALIEKVNGYNKREKFRIRFYNHNSSYIKLEKKSKTNGLCYKEATKITKEQCEALVNNDINWLLTSNNKLFLELYHKMKSQFLKPKTIVDYSREAYIYNPGNVRITFDSDIKSGLSSTDIFNSTLPTLSTSKEKTIILEVKYDEFLPEIIKDIIQTNNRRATAVSKYAACRLIHN